MAQPALVVAPSRADPAPTGGWQRLVPAPTPQPEIEEQARSQPASIPPVARWLLRAGVLAIAIVAPLVAFAGERKVSLDVEGDVRTVHTYAADATDLLERSGVDERSNDLVRPDIDEGLSEGGEVTFRRAKRIDLVLDGEKKTVVARGLTVGEALKDLGLDPGPRDAMHPSGSTKLRPGLEVFVRNAIHAKLRVDGQLRDVVSSADTVSNLLAHAGVTVGSSDYVIPDRDLEPTDGMWIRVVRVRRIFEERNVRMPFSYLSHENAQMDAGVRRVVQQGAEGLKVQRFSVLLEDGVRVSRQQLEDRVVRSARDHIVHVGTKEPQYSGGGDTKSGVASWFEADGLVAAHRTLPMGSVVRVTNVENGKSVTVRINQRGPWVKGRVIDLSDDAFERLAPLDDGTIRVSVET